MNYKHLGENIQVVRKLKKMKQQELADAIGINLQSLSKIERGVNYPTFETLEKIMTVLGVAPNELLSGEWKNTSPIEKDILQFLKEEEKLNVELEHGQYDNFFDSKEEWKTYELKKLREYIMEYISEEERKATDLYPLKKMIEYFKFQKLIDRYDDFYSLDIFGEDLKGHKHISPYDSPHVEKDIITKDYEEHRKILSEMPTIKGFENLEGIE